MNGTQVGGRTLNVNEARPKVERGGGGGGGGADAETVAIAEAVAAVAVAARPLLTNVRALARFFSPEF